MRWEGCGGECEVGLAIFYRMQRDIGVVIRCLALCVLWGKLSFLCLRRFGGTELHSSVCVRGWVQRARKNWKSLEILGKRKAAETGSPHVVFL